MDKILFYLKVSRPGLWFPAIWLYMLPTSLNANIFSTFEFWFGLLYVTFPLNLMVYGWNDIADYEIDKLNPRKDSFWFGARLEEKDITGVIKLIIWTQIICLPLLIYAGGTGVLSIYFGFLVINYLYNKRPVGLRSVPPLELICQFGYLLIVPLSIFINDLNPLGFYAYLYLSLFAMKSHLIGEVMDYLPDMTGGRKTTATSIGIKNTKLLIIVLVVLEILIISLVFQEWFFSLFLVATLLWFVIDLLFIFKEKETYTVSQMKLLAIGSNVIGLMTAIYVWLAGFF